MMKKVFVRIIAALLSVLMILTISGCSDMLSILSEYSDYSDYSDYADYFNSGSWYEDYGYDSALDSEYQYYYLPDDNADDADSSDGVVVVSNVPEENVIDEAIREPLTEIKGNGEDVVTVMIYMCASNLESESGLAYADIKEMMNATSGSNLNIVIETGGCTNWTTSQISASTNQRHIISNGRLKTVDSRVGRKDMTDGETLTDFIDFCEEEYPADRYMLILWDHGAGAVDGWGYDEYNYYDTLTIDELGEALYEADVTFDFIGFDACLMSAMEVACVLYDFADYMIASEDYESGYGWEYKYWLGELAQNTSMSTVEIGKIICDDFVQESGSEDAILAVVDLAYMKLIYSAWCDFAYAAQDQLLDSNFSWSSENTSRRGRVSIDDLYSLIGYSEEAAIADMMAIANAVEGVEEAEALKAALSGAIKYGAANSGCSDMTGLSVTLPYGDSSSYKAITEIFSNVGFDDEYIDFLGKFVDVSAGSDSYDWSEWQDSYSEYDTWSDWYGEGNGDYYDSYEWDDWSGWEDYFTGLLGGAAAGYFSDYYSDYYSDYGTYTDNYSDQYASYDDYFASQYGSDYYDNYYDSYYNGYSDYGFGYSDYYDSYGDYYDYYDNYYDSYYGDYYGSYYDDYDQYYEEEDDSWDSWMDYWFNW